MSTAQNESQKNHDDLHAALAEAGRQDAESKPELAALLAASRGLKDTAQALLTSEIQKRIFEVGADLALPVTITLWGEQWQSVARHAVECGYTLDEAVGQILSDGIDRYQEQVIEAYKSASKE